LEEHRLFPVAYASNLLRRYSTGLHLIGLAYDHHHRSTDRIRPFYVNTHKTLQPTMTDLLHIYAFGSICRGDIAPGSDIDLLAIATSVTNELSRSMFSIYSHSKIRRIWKEGNPFAWHLHLESKLIHSSDKTDFINALGPPAAYTKAREDSERFFEIYRQAAASLRSDHASAIFDLSAAFLGLRNFSTCYLLGQGHPDFSRGAALNLMADKPPIDVQTYRILERARLLCTRGHGLALNSEDIAKAIDAFPRIEEWMLHFIEEDSNGR
jgi:predicted nucleotidyltransferase